jgi:hypothetical protein
VDAYHRPEPYSVTLNTATAGYTEISDEAGYVTRYDQLSYFEYFAEDTTG